MANGEISIDALMPPQMADRAEAIGIKKANTDFWAMFTLAVLAGAFIGAGAMFATVVTADASGKLSWPSAKLRGVCHEAI